MSRLVDPFRVAVLGGGLAGLAAAHRLSSRNGDHGLRYDITLFEASDRLGGGIETREQDGYRIDRGADSFLTNKPAAVELCERLGLADRLQATDARYRGALVLHRGRPVPVPAGFELMAPARLWPLLTTPLLSPRGKARLLAEAFVPCRRDGGDESLGSFVRRRLGREAFDRLVQPLVAGIYTADPERLSLAATLPRFLDMERGQGGLIRAKLKDRRRHKSHGAAEAKGVRYGLFAGLAGGMGRLIDALVRELNRDWGDRPTLRIGTPIMSLSRRDGRWRLTTGRSDGTVAGEEIFDVLVVALPAFRAAHLLGGFDADLAGLLRGIPYASSAVVATGHKLADVRHPLDAFGLVVPAVENRDVLAVSFSSRKFPDRAPEGRVLLRTFVGGATRPDLAEGSDFDLIARVLRELSALLGVTGEPETLLVSRYRNAMPQYHVGHLDLVRKIESAAADHHGLHLTGNAYRGVGIPDVIADAGRAADAAFGTLDRLRRMA